MYEDFLLDEKLQMDLRSEVVLLMATEQTLSNCSFGGDAALIAAATDAGLGLMLYILLYFLHVPVFAFCHHAHIQMLHAASLGFTLFPAHVQYHAWKAEVLLGKRTSAKV